MIRGVYLKQARMWWATSPVGMGSEGLGQRRQHQVLGQVRCRWGPTTLPLTTVAHPSGSRRNGRLRPVATAALACGSSSCAPKSAGCWHAKRNRQMCVFLFGRAEGGSGPACPPPANSPHLENAWRQLVRLEDMPSTCNALLGAPSAPRAACVGGHCDGTQSSTRWSCAVLPQHTSSIRASMPGSARSFLICRPLMGRSI